jgi:hypothetical protein
MGLPRTGYGCLKETKNGRATFILIVTGTGSVTDGDYTEFDGFTNMAWLTIKGRTLLHNITYWSPYLARTSA